jgi:hypothetical protein
MYRARLAVGNASNSLNLEIYARFDALYAVFGAGESHSVRGIL